jgi:AraC family transcriptional regulator, regulatory protein of adaptative response / methylated-DNA-[protein]-cysteine methyltransferase
MRSRPRAREEAGGKYLPENRRLRLLGLKYISRMNAELFDLVLASPASPRSDVANSRRRDEFSAMPRRLPPRDQMMRAFLRSDPAAEGIFFVGVKTTGIFCRPTCKARKPKPENVEFFATPSAALHEGFRPCKLCAPMDGPARPPALVERLRAAVEENPTGRLTDKELTAMKIDPSTARRQFRRYYGMTFQAYHRARRMGLALRDVHGGSAVIDTQQERGFASSSGFRRAFGKTFGVPPSRADGRECLFARKIETPLGTMLALANDEGLHLLDFVDRRGLERKLASFEQQRGFAILPGDHPLLDAVASQLSEYFAGHRFEFDLPLAPRGSDWEHAAWRHLQTIPPGQTKSYSQMAADLGRPAARRAVGRANGMNFLSIVIPCHRVIRADGSLCGYGGGLWRKQWLLDHERKFNR